MRTLILLLLFCVSLSAQSITVSGTTYQLIGDEIMSDPNTFLHQFVEDARERGHDVSGVRGTIIFTEGTGSTKGYSVRYYACRGSFKIGLQEYFWNNFSQHAAVWSRATNLYEQRRHLMYHELGHALLRLNHVCFGERRELAPDLIVLFPVYDIMLHARECGGRYSVESYDYDWEWHLDRMFNPGFQTTYTCYSGKGEVLDY